jgi:hypothetical protein
MITSALAEQRETQDSYAHIFKDSQIHSPDTDVLI